MAESGLSRKVTFLDCKKSHLLVGAHDKSPTIAVSMSIPPHAEGIHHTLAVVLAHAPITPASGGIRPAPVSQNPNRPITPACGEYVATTSVLVQGTDNPVRGGNTIQPVLLGTGSADNPRMRGIQQVRVRVRRLMAITPVSGGNTIFQTAGFSICSDNPRSRGEYITTLIN
jgi:hypothetical protein